jgi:predicted GNAT family acetyltransferase
MPTLAEMLRQGSFENPNNPYSSNLLADALRGSLSNAESLGRGAAVAPLGIFGDVNALAREYITPRLPAKIQAALESLPAAPTTEAILANIPRGTEARRESSGMEQLGAAMNPVGPVEAAKGITKGLGAYGKLAGEAINDAMVYGRGHLAEVTPQPMRMFIGPESSMYNKDAAFEASKLLKKGVPEAEVWAKTGTGKFGDNFVQEISDIGSKFNTAEQIAQDAEKVRQRNLELKGIIKESQSPHPDLFPKELTAARRPLREEIKQNQNMLERNFGYEADPKWAGQLAQIAYEHPSLYEAYPKLKGVVIRQGRDNGNYLGSYERRPSQEVGMVEVAKEGLKNNPNSTAAHEMQHAIQDLEGWQSGGNPEQFVSTQEVNDAKIVANLLGKGQDPSEAAAWVRSNLGRSPSPQVMDIAMNPSKLEFYKGSFTPFERYQRLAGEAQARLTQSRLNLTPEERLQNYPFEYKPKDYGLDVPPNELIFDDKHLGVYGRQANASPAFDIAKRDASDIFGAGAERVKYTDPASGGTMEVLAKPDGTASVLSLEVPEKFRGQGIGQSLQAQVLQDFPEMGGQVSSKAAAKTAYRLGRRPPNEPNATLEDVYKLMDENSSVNLVSPKMQSKFSNLGAYQ